MILRFSSSHLCLLLVLIIGLGGCALQEASFKHSAEQLGTIGAKIQNKPDQANEILKNHDLSRDEFEKSVQRISEDPDSASRYREAFEEEAKDNRAKE